MAKGLAAWRPQAATRERLEEVQTVMEEQRSEWPLSQRYWLYRLMGRFGWEKFDEYNASAYRKANGRKGLPREPYNLNHILDRGRRSGMIEWEAVVATRGMHNPPMTSDSPEDLADLLEAIANQRQFDRQAGQDRRVCLWCETEGLAPTLARTAHPYGALVLAGKGFDVIGRKYDFARTVAEEDDNVLILHAGDLDKSGYTVKTSLDEDLTAFIRDMGGKVEVKRIALLEEHVHTHGLPFTEVEEGLNAGNHGMGYDSKIECQLEAMDIVDIRKLVSEALESNLDMALLNERIQGEAELRREALVALASRS
jgi:hypothetical protein